MEPGIGFHHNVPFSEYVKWKGVNWHSLEPYRLSDRYARDCELFPRDSTDAQTEGEAFHTIMESPQKFDAAYKVMPTFPGHPNSNEHKGAKAQWLAANQTSVVLTEAQINNLRLMRQAVEQHPVAKALADAEGKHEIGLVWGYERQICKGRIDKLCRVRAGVGIDLTLKPDTPVVCLIDWKTTRANALEMFNLERARYAYHAQMAWYCNGLEKVSGVKPVCLLVGVQKPMPKNPYSDVFILNVTGILDEGMKLCDQLLKRKLLADKAGRWEGQAPLIAPSWMYPWESEKNPHIQEADDEG
jgi:hypothetical protein